MIFYGIRRGLYFCLVSLFVVSCSSKGIKKEPYEYGDLIGAFPGESFESVTPNGAVFVGAGSFIFGASGDDSYGVYETTPLKTISITSLYMDETEITNSLYRKFVNVIQEDIIRVALSERVEELLNDENINIEGGILDYSYIKRDSTVGVYYKFIEENYPKEYSHKEMNEIDYGIPLINDPYEYPDVYYAEVMDKFYTFDELGKREFDKDKIVYKYQWVDIEELIKTNNPNAKKIDHLYTEEVKVHPSMDVWVKDFSYSYNEPLMEDYFNHHTYDNYPVVGVDWRQAKAFCNWRTEYKNRYNKSVGMQLVRDFRLPSEVEWEYAARGGHLSGDYPWGGNYLSNEKGRMLANFKPDRGDYTVDGHLYTSQVKSFLPNDFGLYDMSGNVTEWTNSTYREDTYWYFSSITPDYSNKNDDRIVLRGGSWKDVGHFLKVYARDYEYKDQPRSYIGFRTLQEYEGEKIGVVDLEVYFDY